MKKVLFTILALAFFSIASYAQFGITGGVNFSQYKYDDGGDRKSIISWNAGITYRGHKKNGFLVIQPQLLYTTKGAVKYPDIDLNNDILKYTNKISYAEFSMPFLLSIPAEDETIRVELGAGPYFGFVTSAKSTAETFEGDKSTSNFKIGSSNTDDFKSMDAGLSLVAATKVGPIGFNLQYDLGLSNVNPNGNTPALKMRAIMFNMYIYFGK